MPGNGLKQLLLVLLLGSLRQHRQGTSPGTKGRAERRLLLIRTGTFGKFYCRKTSVTPSTEPPGRIKALPGG